MTQADFMRSTRSVVIMLNDGGILQRTYTTGSLTPSAEFERSPGSSPVGAWRPPGLLRVALSNPRAVPVFLNHRLQHVLVEAQVGLGGHPKPATGGIVGR